MIITGVYFSFASRVTTGMLAIVNVYLKINALYWSVLGLGYFLQVIGYSSFCSNIVQFNIDQLIGASADKLSAVIYWHSVISNVLNYARKNKYPRNCFALIYWEEDYPS